MVMLVLWEHGEQPVKRLGERLRLDSGTLSPLLKRLEAAGLVHRERSAHDERSVEVRLTDEGTALRARALQVPRRIMAATGFTLEEIAALRATLNRLTTALDQAAPGNHAGLRLTEWARPAPRTRTEKRTQGGLGAKAPRFGTGRGGGGLPTPRG
ncbi:MarR family transcriptional regulator, partial [Streptomyces sp. e14]